MPETDNVEWLSARSTLDLVTSSIGAFGSNRTISKRCHASMIRTKAEKFIKDREVLVDVELPATFWWAEGQAALTQNWHTGDFDTWIDQRYHWQAFGVSFFKSDVEKMLPEDYEQLTSVSDKAIVGDSKRGRKRSDVWIAWTAELAAYVHEKGIPEGEGTSGVDFVYSAIDGRLIERGQPTLGRTTVQPYLAAVLRRLRSATN
jgi:hypothetical protein